MPRNSLPPFLKKLRHITETVPPDIASWSEDGLSFIIHKKEFESEILKEHFKGNIQTFVRQLHFYGFRKFENGKATSEPKLEESKDHIQAENGNATDFAFSFAHEYFRRDQPHLIFAIKRKTRADNLGIDSVVTSGELRGIGSQVTHLEQYTSKVRKDLDGVLKRLGIEVGIGLGDYEGNKRRRLPVFAAGKELEEATQKQSYDEEQALLGDQIEKDKNCDIKTENVSIPVKTEPKPVDKNKNPVETKAVSSVSDATSTPSNPIKIKKEKEEHSHSNVSKGEASVTSPAKLQT